ncbi:ribonuclease T2-like protein [Filobasidium floriforme]|uniref:ribonuclease T2-like protein n=1 Tax=Filobasidium floriforme TaxID=5210 RepID=UPI001E8D3744|nr:ribonuclease T2-like protein [Filobasidium floriforme]KAH8085381.1 ribonuclease T2-like protein [Filobasidium floriforme]
MRSSHFLSLFAVLLVLGLANAAPHAAAQLESSHKLESRTIGHIWSALELFLYRLTHGGQYPPGYGQAPVTSTSTTAVIPTKTSTTVAQSSAQASTTAITSSTAVPTTAISTPVTSASSTIATSTSTSSTPNPAATGLTVCSAQSLDSFPLSCSSAASTGVDTCCTESPGGHLLLTEFWNTGKDSVGPNTTWTVHGLWPDNCDGSYESYCDPARELQNVTAVIEASGDQELLGYMNALWKSNTGDDESFWEHEFNKHGTCLSTLEPKCFNNFQPQQDAVSYFRKTVATHKTLLTYETLASAGILPSLTQTYTLEQVQGALEKQHGGGVNVNCDGSVFEEVWYHYVSQGSIADGNLVPAPLVGSKSTCPSTGIKYYPKYTTIPAEQPVGSPGGGKIVDGGKVFLYAGPSTDYVAQKNYLTSTGKWYASGTPAGYTLKAVEGGSYTLTTSKGPCAVDGTTKLFSCGAEVTKGSEFVFAADGTLTLGGSGAFSAAQTPSGQNQILVYQNSDNAVKLVIVGIAQ